MNPLIQHLLSLAWLLAAPPAGAESSCQLPAAVVSGDTKAADALAGGLRERGIDEGAEPGCPVVRVTVASTGERLTIQIASADGVVVTRDVQSIDTAVALVETWVRTGLTEALLGTRRVSRPTRSDTHAAVPPASARATASASDQEGLPFSIALHGGASYAGDSTVWSGGQLFVCFELGPVCTGGAISVAVDTTLSGPSNEPGISRLGASLALTAELPLKVGPIVLSPGLGVGLGWLRSTYQGPPEDDQIDGGGFQAKAFLFARGAVAERWSLEAMLFFELNPMARTDLQEDPDDKLPGEPFWHAGLSLGVRFGDGLD